VNSLKTIAGVDDVQVDLEHQHVQVLGDEDVGTRVQERLQAMGYLSMKPGV
jgi:copper chaperone CopZ